MKTSALIGFYDLNVFGMKYLIQKMRVVLDERNCPSFERTGGIKPVSLVDSPVVFHSPNPNPSFNVRPFPRLLVLCPCDMFEQSCLVNM